MHHLISTCLHKRQEPLSLLQTEKFRSTEDITEDKISTLTYPGKGSFVHYQDDNETFAYRNGAYNAVEYTMDGDKLEKKVLHKGL